jgi:parallel beta-helix repeat protein
VTGFQRGIRLKEVRKNKIVFNIVHTNGNAASQVGYGIDVAGAQENLFKGNFVHHNADEGIHVGTGSHGNTFLNNRIEDNGRENVYFLFADRGVLRENSTRGGSSASLFIKHSAFMQIEKNTFHDEPVILRGNSHNNVLVDNEVLNAGIRLQPYEEQGTWTYPSKNRVSGGKIHRASECLSFASASENTVQDVVLTECGKLLVSKADLGPAENTLVGIPFTPKDALLDEKSVLHVGWRLAIAVKDKSGIPVAEAQVRGVDAQQRTIFEAVTDATGAIPPQNIIEQTRRGETSTSSLPLTVVVSLGKKTVSQKVNVTRPTSFTITFSGSSRSK